MQFSEILANRGTRTGLRLFWALVAGLLLFSSGPARAADALNPGDLDTSFKINGGADQSITTLVINTNVGPHLGKMYIGGSFIDYGDQGTGIQVARFARLNVNGSLDMTWWNTIKGFNQPGANDKVNIVTLDNQGRVLVGGRFKTFFGKSILYLVRLNADGTLDETFNNGKGSTFGPNDEVTAISVTPAGKVLIAGQFTSYSDGNQTLTRNQMVRLNADMTIDTTFDGGPGTQSTTGSPIATIVEQPDGKILIGGEFQQFQSTPVGRITRLNSDGTLDTTFNPSGAGLASGNIREIELLPDGRIVAVGNIVSYNGTGTGHMIILSPTGVLDTSFAPNVSAQIRAVERQSDGKYLIVGDFRTVGVTARPAAARLNADGTVDTTFNPGTGTFRTPESPNTLDAVIDGKLDPDNNLVIVGDFTHWNTIEFVNHITRIATEAKVVNNETPPVITAQPQSLTACTGTNVSFTVTATGTAPFSYQWSLNGTPISGATAATYSIATVATSDAGSYSVTITNSVGSTNSNAATLTVETPPAIAAQPQTTGVNTGGSFTLSVTVTGTSPFTYQWSKNGAPIGGATAATYTVASAAAGDAGNYTVLVSNGCGSVTSASATVTVNPPNVVPSISAQPQSQTVCVGTNVAFSVTANGSTPIAYQWSLNGAPIAGATAATYSIPVVSTASAGSYTVFVSNSSGNVTSTAATLTVLTPPTVTAQPQSTSVGTGGSFTLSVGVSGTSPFTYQWSRNGTPIGGATGANYTVGSASAGDAGTYTVQVSNACGSTTSAGATVTFAQVPNLVGHPLPQQVKAGSSASFNVVALGDAPLSYQWFFNGSAIGGATSQTLVITGVSASNAGNYSVLVSNGAGSASSTNALLTVLTPPVISTPPQTQTVLQGNTLTLATSVTGTDPLSYQWKLNGVDVSGATAATLTIPNVQLANAGTYSVTISNICAVVTSPGATVTVGIPPAISGGGQPLSQTVCVGTNVSMSVTATGTAPLAYQWALNGAPIAGATTAAIIIPAVAAGNAGSYTVQISNAHGTVTSTAATLTVQTPPAISVPPQTTTVLQGNTLNLSVTATGTAPLSYQWKVNGAPITGATGASLNIPNIQANQAGSYTVDVINACGTVTSPASTVTVGIPPTIVSGGQPQSQVVCTGTNVSLSVTASGTAPLSYQWSLNGSPISGATTATLVIPSVATANGGFYTVQISNAHGNVTSSGATLTVQTPPSILVPPQTTTVLQGNTLNLSVTATGTAPLSYQWKVNGAPITGATGASLNIPNIQASQAGSYTVDVINACGTVTSPASTVTVGIPPTIVSGGQPQSQVVCTGTNVSLSVTASGTAPLGYQWSLNGSPISGATTATLVIPSVATANGGFYTVQISNAHGNVTSSGATLTVQTPPSILVPPQTTTVLQGNTLNLSVTATGTAPLSYQWKVNGAPISGATTSVLSLSNIQASQAGSYTVDVTNPCGTITSPGSTVTVGIPPAIAGGAQPQSQVVCVGTNVAMSVTASGTAPLSYQWSFNGAAINGATAATLVIPFVTTANDGLYTVFVSNAHGSVTSVGATLTVQTPPSILIAPQATTVVQGNTLNLSVTAGGTGPLTYQWKLNGVAIGGATSSTLNIANLQASQAGTYTVDVGNPCGSITSTGVQVTVGIPPTFTGQPQDQAVIAGSPAAFAPTFTGDGPCTFQWRKNGVNIPGATGQSLTFANAQEADEAGYSVVITCPFGTVVSRTATLTVQQPPLIISNPLDQSVIAGSSASFSVAASGDPTITYQWFKNGVLIPGATSTTLVIINAQDADEGAYSATATNPFGNATSTAATLTVNNPPNITGQPQPQVVLEGSPASFTVSVTADGACTFQWRRNGVTIPGATSQTLLISNSRKSDEANYSVVITCPFGTVTSQPASLTVNRPPIIITPPASQTVLSGTTVTFGAVADGDPTLFYQWRKNGVTIPGANALTLTLPNVQDADEALYSVVVTNAFGTATSTSAQLTVNNPPTITGQPQPQEVIEGNTATFTLTVGGDGPCTYLWRFNGVNFQQTTVPTLTIPNAQRSQAGDYSVVVTCPYGSVTSQDALLTVRIPPKIIVQPLSQTVVQGSNAVMNVTAVGDPTLIYQWRFNGVALTGQTNTFLILNNVQPTNAGNYSLVVTNAYGAATSANALLAVKLPPVVVTPPQPQSVVVGQPGTFTVTHTGDGPCTYQWLKAGVPLPGATSQTLTIPNSQVSDQGLYSIVITCPFGAVTSPPARLTVNEPPVIVVHPVSQAVLIGNSVVFSGAAVGTPTLFYQWRKNGVAIPGATTVNLTLPNVGTNDIAQYSFVVTNAFGSATSSNATLTLNYPAVIIDQPQGIVRPIGTPGTFTVGVTGTGPCTYQWRKNGVNIAGATSVSYTIPAVAKTDEANYSVVVTCPFGTVTSVDAPLAVTEPPRIVFHPISENVITGTNAVISVLAEGTETLTYQWYYQTSAGTPNGTPLAGRTLPTLHIAGVTTNNTGVYYCIVKNSLGSETSRTATITVLNPGDLTGGSTGAAQRTFAVPQVANGQITLQFSSANGQVATTGSVAGIVIQASSNLVNWTTISASIAVVNGQYQVVLNDPAGLAHRFYRVIYP
ncbi:MAG: immunoglobulin domain-containing protein [Verrucomicrobiae bacterium]|nr:immunoglobulin domain-containing protein [Verrucomicrobiae bacterium]